MEPFPRQNRKGPKEAANTATTPVPSTAKFPMSMLQYDDRSMRNRWGGGGYKDVRGKLPLPPLSLMTAVVVVVVVPTTTTTPMQYRRRRWMKYNGATYKKMCLKLSNTANRIPPIKSLPALI
mmetsp:Transcript_20501/g.28480  ORF Transcript_20501/g.28480 Transcript_20501/m.28480 type:complete len:122 (+) Transcript_20501:296-661(+)